MNVSSISKIDDLKLSGKRVFLRVDFNCPIKDGKVSDDTRIQAALPTVQKILERGGRLMVGSHLGRPKGKKDLSFSLRPVAERLGELTGKEIVFVEDPLSDAPKALANQLKPNQVLVLENLRFSPDEKAKTGKLANQIASYTDVYINDAFGVCHRKDASVYDLAHLIPKRGMGLLIEKEIEALSAVRDKPQRPFGVIMGGAKVSDKIPMIEKFLDQTDVFVIGGAMAFTFLKALGRPVGKSLVEEDLVKFCKDLIERLRVREDKKLILPIDFYEAASITDDKAKLTQSISDEMAGFDIGPKSTELFLNELSNCKSILWNGPMGVFENPAFENGSKLLCEGLSKMTSHRVVGGGDTAAAAKKFNGSFDHISTGGGASLSFLEGHELPGLAALKPLRKEILEESREQLIPIDPEEFEKKEGQEEKENFKR